MTAVETIGDALRAGWGLIVRCAYGRRHGLKQIRECRCAYALDLPTLVWTRGAEFPVERLEERLRCPECGSRRVRIVRDIPMRDP